jgi:hypothetical protein
MACYFNQKSHKGRHGIFRTVASVISDDYKAVFKNRIQTKSEYASVAALDHDRVQEREIVQNVTQKHYESLVALIGVGS